MLELRGISKSFGAIRALSEMDLSLEPGEVLGLMGDNGAGKSTLVRIIAGNFPASTGEMRLNGAAVHFHRPLDARRNGIEIPDRDEEPLRGNGEVLSETAVASRTWRWSLRTWL